MDRDRHTTPDFGRQPFFEKVVTLGGYFLSFVFLVFVLTYLAHIMGLVHM